MPIPEGQLQAWSNLGAQATAKLTHEAVRKALANHPLLLGEPDEDYLQGSYRNVTNIRGDSDVDIVAQRNQACTLQIWLAFYAKVMTALEDRFGASKVKPGNKAIKLLLKPIGLLEADVVVCNRHYNDRFVEGMIFYARDDSRWVINYPKEHIDNGQNRNTQTSDWYKKSIRMFKNSRQPMIDRSLIYNSDAPSYFLECLLYNVPYNLFGVNFTTTYCQVVTWLMRANLNTFICQNGQVMLFGDTPEQWSTAQSRRYIEGLAWLWERWPN